MLGDLDHETKKDNKECSMDKDEDATGPVDFDVSVVLPAGGCGQRFGCDLPKQYNILLDKPVILHTINAFHRISWIKRVVVVVNKSFLPFMEQLVQDNCLDKVVLVKGCSTRHRSIYAGVKSLVKGEDKSSVVVIHDAVRPLIDETVVKKIVCYAKTYGASGVTRPLVSTVISPDDDGLLKESLDRSQYCASEMPQGFQLKIIQTAYEMSDDNDFDYGTECLLLAMKYTGTRAKLFTGPDNLWKVTHRKDLYAAEAILKERNISVQVIFSSCSEDQDLLNAVLSQCRNKMLVVKENKSSGSVSCNSAVFIYSQITKSAISENTQSVLKPTIDTKVTMETLLQPCIIHVYNGRKLNNEDTFEYMRIILEMTENFPDSLSFGILNFNIADYKKLSDMVTSLVWNRDSTLSGQTFVIHSNKNNKI